MTPKQIIVDKSAFDAINPDAFFKFANDHLLLVCDTLLYECATTSKSKRENKLHNYKRLVESGAYYCSCSVAFIQSEGKSCCSYPWFLPDLDATEQIRTKKARLDEILNSHITEKVFQSRYKVAQTMFVDLSKKLENRIDVENPGVGKAVKDLPTGRFARLQKLFERIDASDLHQVGVDSVLRNWVKNETKFCLSSEWISWQYIRLTDAIVQDYYYLRQMGGVPGGKRAEHDYQDMEYVLLLSRADGLLTRDDGCKCLAQVAFPKKDIFSDLNEVPDEYICHWG
ncbi:MAG: hypothetical protein WC476_09645 [Phycisphaerae bacterium]|jgi:hypothetical protein